MRDKLNKPRSQMRAKRVSRAEPNQLEDDLADVEAMFARLQKQQFHSRRHCA